MLGMQYRFRMYGVAVVSLLAVLAGSATPSSDPSLEQLKARLATTSTGDRPHLCIEIAQRQMAETSKLFAAGEDEKAQAALAEVVQYSELARDYSLQSRKYQKQAEIAVRQMTRKLGEIEHSLSISDQGPVRDAVSHLQRVRDDLLIAMFPKGLH
jgi:hypothetical protein